MEKFWRGFNLAHKEFEIFGVDLIWRSENFVKFGADLIWRSKNFSKKSRLDYHHILPEGETMKHETYRIGII